MNKLQKFRVTYLGRRPRSSEFVSMTTTIYALNEQNAKRVTFQTRSSCREILKIENKGTIE